MKVTKIEASSLPLNTGFNNKNNNSQEKPPKIAVISMTEEIKIDNNGKNMLHYEDRMEAHRGASIDILV